MIAGVVLPIMDGGTAGQTSSRCVTTFPDTISLPRRSLLELLLSSLSECASSEESLSSLVDHRPRSHRMIAAAAAAAATAASASFSSASRQAMSDVTVQDAFSHHHHNGGASAAAAAAAAANSRGLQSKKALRPRMSCNQCRFRKVKVNTTTYPSIYTLFLHHSHLWRPTVW